MKKLVKKIKGFTLVELMVAVAIGIVAVSLGVVSINNFYNKQKIDAATNEVAGIVRLAKNYAVTSQSPGGYGGTVEYVGLVIGSDGLMSIVPGNNLTGLNVGTTYTSKKIDIIALDISQLNAGVLMFSMPEGKLLQFVAPGTTRTEPRDSGESVNILIRSKQDVSEENGVLIYSSGSIDEKANELNQVPTEAIGDDNTLTNQNNPEATIAPTPTNSLVATSTPQPTSCSSCPGKYVSSDEACYAVCGSACNVAPRGCFAISSACGSASCYIGAYRPWQATPTSGGNLL